MQSGSHTENDESDDDKVQLHDNQLHIPEMCKRFG